MTKLTAFSRHSLTAALLAVGSASLSACSRPRLVKSNGVVSIFGVLYYVLAVLAILDIFKQPWSMLRKLIWTVVVLVPLGLILYYLVSGRNSRS